MRQGMACLVFGIVLFFLQALAIAQSPPLKEDASSEVSGIRLGLPVSHTAHVTSAVFSADRKMVLTASWDHTAKLWDVESGKLLRTFNDELPVTSAVFSPDRKMVLTASLDKTAKLWDVESGKLLYSFVGHTSYVWKAVFSPDGKKVLTASWDKTAKLWDVESGKLLRTFKRHTSEVLSAVFSPDGRSVLTASWESAKLWDVGSGKILHSFQHTSRVTSAVFSPDGKKVLTASWDKTAKLWDMESGILLQKFIGHTSAVESAVFNPEGKKMLTASWDTTAILWDVNSGHPLHSLEGHSDKIISAVFSPDGQRVLTASHDKTAKLWDVANGELLHSFKGHTSDVLSAIFSPDGKKLLITDNRNLRLWDVDSGEMVFSLGGYTCNLNVAAFSPDGKMVLTASDDNTAKLWDRDNGKIVQSFEDHTQAIESAVFSPDGKKLLTASLDSTGKLWDVVSGQPLHSFEGHTSAVRSAIFSPDGTKVLTASWDETARLWNVENGKLLHSFEGHTSALTSAVFNPDGRSVLTASWESAKLWDVANGELLHSFEGHTSDVQSAIFSPDGKSVLTASWDSTAKLWDVGSGKILHSFEGHTEIVHSAVFSPDGKMILTASVDYTAKLWDVGSGKILHSFEGHNDWVNSTLFSPDGKMVLTASDDNTAKLWDVGSGKLLYSFKGHTGTIESAVFSPDGKQVLTASSDGSIIIWDLATKRKLLRHFFLQDNQSITLAENGLFDATAGAMDLMYWVKGTEIIEFSQLKERYWEPGLWEKVMRGEPLRDVQGMEQVHSPPEVHLAAVERGILPITLRKRDGGYGKVSVQINGKEIEADARGGNLLDSGLERHTLYLDLSDHPQLLPGRENTISVQAWNEGGYVAGRSVIVTYTPEGKGETVQPAFHAVICGVNDYARDSIKLRYAEPDARAVATAVRLGAERLFGTQHTHIHILTSPGERAPTKENIRQAFEQVAVKARPGDILLLYLAGHGITWGGEQGDFFFLTSEAYSSAADAYNDPEIRKRAAISTLEFTEWIKRIPALKQVMIIDACGSGKAVENVSEDRNVDASRIKAIDRMKDRMGMFIISGCAADAVSYEASRFGQGLLTYALLQAMKGAALREDRFVDVNTMISYARERVPVLAGGVGGIQTPQLLIPKSGSFDIGLMEEEQRRMIPLADPKPVFVRSSFTNTDEREDDLELSAYLDQRLRDVAGRGRDAALIFVDAKQYPDGCKVTGSYISSKGKWQLNGRMRCGSEVRDFDIVATSETELRENLAAWVTLHAPQ